jgi:NitT/TauT family transport system substrate-binding protein
MTKLRNILLFAAGLMLVLSTSASAQDKTRIRFTLDWKIQGVHSWYYWAEKKGYFAAENLDVVIDQGEGSAATVTRIISGTYDAGFGDVNALIQTAAQRPGEAPVMVMMIYSKAPFAIVTKASSPIKTVRDLVGRKLGAPAGAAATRLFVPLAARNGIDPKSVEILNMAPNLQEQMMLQGQVDASAVFTATSYMNLVAQRLDPDKDFRWLYYQDSGLDLYSNGVMVSAKLAREKPEAVKGLVRAITRAMKEVLADPAAAVNLLVSIEPLLPKEIERRRLIYVTQTLIATPEAAALGVGDINDERMKTAIKTIVDSYQLPRTPEVKEVFNRTFLMPKPDRMLPAVAN